MNSSNRTLWTKEDLDAVIEENIDFWSDERVGAEALSRILLERQAAAGVKTSAPSGPQEPGDLISRRQVMDALEVMHDSEAKSGGDLASAWRDGVYQAMLEVREISAPSGPLSDPLQKLVDEQAEDEGLWGIAANIVEAYLQQELRRLHAAIENRPAVSPVPPTAEPLWTLKQIEGMLNYVTTAIGWDAWDGLGAVDELRKLFRAHMPDGQPRDIEEFPLSAPPVAPTADETSKWCTESHSVTSKLAAPHPRTERCGYPRDSRLASPAPSVGELEWELDETREGSMSSGYWHIIKYAGPNTLYGLTWSKLRIRDDEYWQPMGEFDTPEAAKSLANSLQRILSGAAE